MASTLYESYDPYSIYDLQKTERPLLLEVNAKTAGGEAVTAAGEGPVDVDPASLRAIAPPPPYERCYLLVIVEPSRFISLNSSFFVTSLTYLSIHLSIYLSMRPHVIYITFLLLTGTGKIAFVQTWKKRSIREDTQKESNGTAQHYSTVFVGDLYGGFRSSSSMTSRVPGDRNNSWEGSRRMRAS